MNKRLLTVAILLLATLAIEFGFYTIALKRPYFPDTWAKVKTGMSREKIVSIIGKSPDPVIVNIKGFEFYIHKPSENEIWKLELVFNEENELLNSITYRYIDDRNLFPGQGRIRNLSAQNPDELFLSRYTKK